MGFAVISDHSANAREASRSSRGQRAATAFCASTVHLNRGSTRLATRRDRADVIERPSLEEYSTSASLIGHSGSSTFRLSTTAVSMSLAGSCFSPESAAGPFHHRIRG
jgi:hypothetical protein